MGFDSKQNFSPPTILLGLILCPWKWVSFIGGIQSSPVDGCSAVNCNFGVLAGEDECTSFYSTIPYVQIPRFKDVFIRSGAPAPTPLTHLKRPWCREWLKVREGHNRGWDNWVASPTRLTWVWVSSGSWWWTGKPGVLQSMGLQKVGHSCKKLDTAAKSWTQLSDWTELNWS